VATQLDRVATPPVDRTPPAGPEHEGLAGKAAIKPDYDPRLTNEDLAPLKEQKWGTYNIFAFWMSDVHSVGGYVTAGSLFALGLAGWQVLVALLVGISIVNVFCNLVAKPSQATGVPYPVINRSVFGVRGANIPAIIRGLIAVCWYGIQTYLASAALDVVLLKLFPGLTQYESLANYGFLGLPLLGWGSFAFLWILQVLVFWRGMESIRRFIDFCGPAVYVVMFLLCGYMIQKAGFSAINLNLGHVTKHGWAAVGVTLSAVALVVSYFSGPMLNFGDFSRYSKSFKSVKRGNFFGLPLNFVAFSLLVVITASLTISVYGSLITDPVQTVARTNSTFAIILGALTFTIATIGINIVANFISPAFDFSNVSPQKISWRMGGMIAAVGSVLITPWNLYNNPTVIHLTLDSLGALIGPLFGVLIADYYLVHKQKVVVDDLFTMKPTGAYWYRKGYNPAAVFAVIGAGAVALFTVLFNGSVHGLSLSGMKTASDYSWFIGCGLAFAGYLLLATRTRLAIVKAPGAPGFRGERQRGSDLSQSELARDVP
jgi:NCS1 family nucleobase:cation symporter-1